MPVDQAYSSEEHHESIPLDDNVRYRRNTDRRGYFFSKGKIAAIAVVVLLLFIAVIVLAVLVGIFAPTKKGIQFIFYMLNNAVIINLIP